MAKERVNLTIDPDLWKRAKEFARQRHTSASALVAEALERALTNVDARREMVRQITAMNLPIGTPEEIEERIARSRSAGVLPKTSRRRTRVPKSKAKGAVAV
jgi:Family of unknown function (DUF6364)